LGRKPRTASESGFYHVINRGNNKCNLFQDSGDFQSFLKLLADHLSNFQIKLYHYCLMTNHIHLLMGAGSVQELSRFMHSLQRSYHHYFRKKHSWFGHLFQGRYRSFPIEKEEYLMDCGRYIEKNPVRAKLATEPQDWPYSSYRAYALGELQSFLTSSAFYESLSLNPVKRQEVYRDYVESSRSYEESLDKQLIEI
jgi:putative transposase